MEDQTSAQNDQDDQDEYDQDGQDDQNGYDQNDRNSLGLPKTGPRIYMYIAGLTYLKGFCNLKIFFFRYTPIFTRFNGANTKKYVFLLVLVFDVRVPIF